MVRVIRGASDPCAAWRVRDALASHPLLGGATAQIEISASSDMIQVEGWTLDATVERVAIQLARRAAGRRAVTINLKQKYASKMA